MHNKFKIGFKLLLILFLLFYTLQYLLGLAGGAVVKNSVLIDIVVFIFFYVSYLWRYRKNNILCFELMALPVAFLGLFFDDIIYPIAPELVNLFSVSSESVKIKSETLQMAAILVLLLGGAIGNERRKKAKLLMDNSYSFDYNMLIYLITGVILLLIIYDYVTGIFNSWFFYSNADWMDREDRNQGLGHLTCLLLAASAVEIKRLESNGATDFWNVFKKSNKLFVAEWLLVSVLLFMSGNRNEMLLILLPFIVGYTKIIKPIPNKALVVALFAGVVLMAIAGVTRQEEVSLTGNDLTIMSFTRDFADLGYNTDYLIQYTDKNGTTNFQGVFGMLLSGVPFIGNVILSAINYKAPLASSRITTESVFSNSGLGTSLIGDLYYTGGFIWVMLFLFIFGYVMSRIYKLSGSLNIYFLIFYSYMVANAVYYMRSSWIFPITEIEYAMIIVLIGQIFCRKRKKMKI